MTESQFRTNVQEFVTAVNMRPGCFSQEEDSEGYFSWSSCDCCRDTLGGTRYDCTYATEDGTIDEMSICSDCLYFLTYGRLQDVTYFDPEPEENEDERRRRRRMLKPKEITQMQTLYNAPVKNRFTLQARMNPPANVRGAARLAARRAAIRTYAHNYAPNTAVARAFANVR